jgi:hypothetical protein
MTQISHQDVSSEFQAPVSEVSVGAAIIDPAGVFSVADIVETVGRIGEHLKRISEEIPIHVPLETMSRRLIEGDSGLVVFREPGGVAAVAVACPALVPPPTGPRFLVAIVDVCGVVPDSEAFPTLLEGWAKVAHCVGVVIMATGEMPCPEGYELETIDGRSVMTRRFMIN